MRPEKALPLPTPVVPQRWLSFPRFWLSKLLVIHGVTPHSFVHSVLYPLAHI